MIVRTEKIKRVKVVLEADERKFLDTTGDIIYNIQQLAENAQDEYLIDLCHTVIKSIGEIVRYNNEILI